MMFAKNRLGLGRLFSLSNHRRHWVIFHWMALTFSGSSTSSLPAKKTTDLHISKVKHKNICHKTHRVISSSSSNLILMSCQQHRVTSGQSDSGHKQMHISKLFSHIYQPSVKSVYKINLCQVNLQNQSLCKHKTYIHKYQTQFFEELVSFNVTTVKRAHKARTSWYRRPSRLI